MEPAVVPVRGEGLVKLDDVEVTLPLKVAGPVERFPLSSRERMVELYSELSI